MDYYVHDLNPIAFEILGFQIKWYAFAYVFSLLFGQYYLKFIILHKKLKINIKLIDLLMNYIMIGMILGARLGYVIFYGDYFVIDCNTLSDYFDVLFDILNIRQGGLSFHGGILGGPIFVYFFCKKYNIEVKLIFDLICATLPFGIFFGRIANFINGELYGKPTNKNWGVVFWDGESWLLRHPSQIYEAISEGLLLFVILNIILWQKDYVNKQQGLIGAIFLILYSIIRFSNEYFRESACYYIIFQDFSMGQILSIVMFIFGIYMLLSIKKQKIKFI